MSADHIDDETLELYILNRLDDEQLASVEEHLLLCEECQRRESTERMTIERIIRLLKLM